MEIKSFNMKNIKNILTDIKNKNIIRVDFDYAEMKQYYQYRFKIKKDTNLDFKFYVDNGLISQIYINGIEYLGIYKIEVLDEIIKNINKRIDTSKFLIK